MHSISYLFIFLSKTIHFYRSQNSIEIKHKNLRKEKSFFLAFRNTKQIKEKWKILDFTTLSFQISSPFLNAKEKKEEIEQFVED